MKKMTIMTALLGLTIGASTALATTYALPGKGVVLSKHDMNQLPEAGTMTGRDSQGRVCAFCHTPHHKLESNALDYNPLWSHQINIDTNFIAYDSVTFDSNLASGDPLVGPSRLCMSCHDGSIAVDQHYGMAGNATRSGDTWNEIAIGKNSDLSNDHPIGFSLVGINDRDKGIRATLQSANNPLLMNAVPITYLGYKDVNGDSIMTCASCHDVHNKDNVDTAFLYEQQSGSQFCLMCHDK